MAKIKIAIIAGEASGDDIAGILIGKLRALCHDNCELLGVGGAKMHQAGCDSLFDYHILHKVGLLEILPHIFKLHAIINETAQRINEFNPDILITIDAPGFTKRVAQKISGNAKKIHIVAPSVWAWKAKRRFQYAKIYDKLLCLFPFEPAYFADTRLETIFVGHPLVQTINKIALPAVNHNQILILCGSRPSEIAKNAPLLAKTQALISKIAPNTEFVSFTTEKYRDFLQNSLQQGTKIFTDQAHKYQIFASSGRAIAVSGTVCLELGLLGIPSIITYQVNHLTYFLLKLMVKIKNYGIVNILCGRIVQDEYMQYQATAENLAHAILAIHPHRDEGLRLELQALLTNNGQDSINMMAQSICHI